MIQIHSPSHLVAVIQGLAIGSFEKRYGAMKTADVVNIFAFVTQDLTPEQLVAGINTMANKGFSRCSFVSSLVFGFTKL